MIKEKKPVTMAEAREMLSDVKTEKAQELADFIKKFTKMSASDAADLKKQLLEHKMIKLKEEDIVKLIDFMPEDASDVRKILAGSEVGLDQDEIEKILSAFKKK
jgi:DNA-directed RNA polymerase subunit F